MKVQSAETIFRRGTLDRNVTIIIPSYNYAHLIEKTLASVAAQTFEDLALIIVDDASKDASCAVIERWMRDCDAKHLTLMLVANTANAGLAITRNTGIGLSRSEYCFFLDPDNLLLPRCIEKHVRALAARADCVGAYSMLEEFGGKSGLIGSNVFSRDRLKHGNYIDAMAMVRRDALETFGGFHPMDGWEDFDLWLRMCEAEQRLLHLPEILSRYLHHSKSMSRQQTNIGETIRNLYHKFARLHPWLQLAALPPQTSPGTAPKQALVIEHPIVDVSAVARAGIDPYKQYERTIFAKLDELAHRRPLPVGVEIDTDYTGPVHATPFDSFMTPRQRDDSAKHTVRMLQLGIVGINPQPGVHAARDESGALIRYRSIPAASEIVTQLPPSVLIHIHAFYPDVVEEMLDCFVDSAQHGRFIVTTTTEKNQNAVSRIIDEREFPNAETVLIGNRGRDIGPFLDHALDYASDGDVICHVHTKKSPDVGGTYGEKWRKLLYGALLTQEAVDAFADRQLGLLFPETSRAVGWGKNRPYCEEIAKGFSRTLAPHPGPMPVGNMFFARAEVAQAMREATRDMEWPREPVPYDGTVLHAIERMWPMACEHTGLDWATIYAPYRTSRTAKIVPKVRLSAGKRK